MSLVLYKIHRVCTFKFRLRYYEPVSKQRSVFDIYTSHSIFFITRELIGLLSIHSRQSLYLCLFCIVLLFMWTFIAVTNRPANSYFSREFLFFYYFISLGLSICFSLSLSTIYSNILACRILCIFSKQVFF